MTKRCAIWVATGLFLASGAVVAGEAQKGPGKAVQLDVAAQPMIDALNQLATQAGIRIVFYTEVTKGVTAPQVVGSFTADEALRKLLESSELQYRFKDERTVEIRSAGEGGKAVGNAAGVDGMQMAQGEGAASTDAGRGSEYVKGEQQASTAAVDSETKPQEIVVTATKRVERVQDIPLSIAVIGGQDIERRSVVGMEDYLRAIPGVNLVDRGAADNVIVIRGVSVSQESEYFSSGGTTVATFFDETPISGAGGGIGIDVRPVDLERIEVLRGPQGTAYGSSSLGGTLRMIPVKPKLDGFSAKVSASYSDTGGFGDANSMIQGVVNVPVADTFALRAVGYRYDESGIIENIGGVDPATIARATNFGIGSFVTGFTQDDVGAMVSTGGRVIALWAPVDRLDLSLTYLQQTIEQVGSPLVTSGTFQQARMPVDPRGRTNGELGEAHETKLNLASLVLNYDLGWGALTSAASWVDGKASSSLDISSLLGRPTTDFSPRETESFSAETRLASQLEGRVRFLGGLFYEKVDWDFLEIAYWPGTAFSVPNSFGDPMFVSDRTRHLDQRAVFGEVAYDLTDTLTATLGGRFFRYERSERSLREGTLAGTPFGTGVTLNPRTTEDGSNLKANLSYKPTRDTLLYASWSEGFRLGRPDPGLALCDLNGDGIVDNTAVSVVSTQNIASDTLENFEVGAKVALFNRRMTVDAAVYHIKWDGLPVRSGLPSSTGCNVSFNINAGEARSEGVEVQASLSVMEGLRLDFGGGYTHAELAKDALTLVPPAFEGDRLPGSPKVSANFAAQYDFEVAGYKAFVRGDSFYTGEFYGNFLQTPGLRAGEYIKVDARAGVAIRNLSVELYVRNLTDQDDFTWRGAGGSQSGAGNPFYGYRLRPRTLGIQLGYSFE